jgi:hydrogenase nickel incorporation protein HypB
MINAFRVKTVKESILANNDKTALEVKNEMKKDDVFLVNLMSSPGSGKTTTLVKTIEALKSKYKIGVMEADIDSDVDAKTIAKTGAKTIQLHTAGECHLDAKMMQDGLKAFDAKGLDIVFLENIGNLVCPAEFDTGANKKVMILSVPEGDDKPLKYPLMFKVSDVLLVNKIDAMKFFDFNLALLEERVRKLNPHIVIIPISAKTGEGIDKWVNWLTDEVEKSKKQNA